MRDSGLFFVSFVTPYVDVSWVDGAVAFCVVYGSHHSLNVAAQNEMTFSKGNVRGSQVLLLV